MEVYLIISCNAFKASMGKDVDWEIVCFTFTQEATYFLFVVPVQNTKKSVGLGILMTQCATVCPWQHCGFKLPQCGDRKGLKAAVYYSQEMKCCCIKARTCFLIFIHVEFHCLIVSSAQIQILADMSQDKKIK